MLDTLRGKKPEFKPFGKSLRRDDPPDEPGKFRVSGVDKRTKEDAIFDDVEANSAANARAKVELEGIIVTRVDRL